MLTNNSSKYANCDKEKFKLLRLKRRKTITCTTAPNIDQMPDMLESHSIHFLYIFCEYSSRSLYFILVCVTM